MRTFVEAMLTTAVSSGYLAVRHDKGTPVPGLAQALPLLGRLAALLLPPLL